MGSKWWIVLCAAVFVALAPSAYAEDVEGQYFIDNDRDSLFGPFDTPLPGEPILLTALPGSAGGPFDAIMITDPIGAFSFTGVPPGTYQLLALEPSDPLLFDEFTVITLPAMPMMPVPVPPTGFTVPTGAPTRIDRVAQTPDIPRPEFCLGIAADQVSGFVGFSDYDVEAIDDGRGGFTVDDCYTFGAPFVFKSGVEVVLTPIDPPGPPVSLLTTNMPFVFDSPVPLNGIVEISVDPNQAALDGCRPLTPTTAIRSNTGELFIDEVPFVFIPDVDVVGKVFLEDEFDNAFDPDSDLGVPCATVRLLRPNLLGPGFVVLRTTTTDESGCYRFDDLDLGLHLVQVDSDGGATRTCVVDVMTGSEPGETRCDFGFLAGDPPAVTSCAGPLHSFCAETSFWVGEWFDWVEVSVKLRDGAGRHAEVLDHVHLCYHGEFPGPVASPDGVVGILDVRKENGIATVRVSVIADEKSFPAGFFGDVLRRLEVKVNGCKNVGIARLNGSELWPGMEFTWLEDRCGPRPPPGTEVDPDEECGPNMRQFRVIKIEGWKIWRFANPRECREQSEDTRGGVNHVELEIDHWARPRPRFNVLDIEYACDRRLGRVRLRFQGDSWEGERTNRRLTVLSVKRVEGNEWKVCIRLEARDRRDGNPGALPDCWCYVRSRLNGRTKEPWFALQHGLELGPYLIPGYDVVYYTVKSFQNAIDEAACRYAVR